MKIIAKLFSSRKIYIRCESTIFQLYSIRHNHVMSNFHKYNRCLSYVRAYIIL